MAIIISADDLKSTIPGYDPAQSHLVHRESARLADKLYEDTLKQSDINEVILLSGGSASGKTEFISKYLVDKQVIILDGTLPSLEGARIKIRKAQKASKKVRIVAIWPEDFKIAFSAFLQRDRKFPDEHFYKTHAQSRKTLLEIAEKMPDIPIDLYEVSYHDKYLLFYEYILDTRQELLEELRDNQYTERRIIDIISNNE